MPLMPSKQIIEMMENVLKGKEADQKRVEYHVAELRMLGDIAKEDEFRKYNSNLLSEIKLLGLLIARSKGELK